MYYKFISKSIDDILNKSLNVLTNELPDELPPSCTIDYGIELLLRIIFSNMVLNCLNWMKLVEFKC